MAEKTRTISLFKKQKSNIASQYDIHPVYSAFFYDLQVKDNNLHSISRDEFEGLVAKTMIDFTDSNVKPVIKFEVPGHLKDVRNGYSYHEVQESEHEIILSGIMEKLADNITKK